MITNIHLYFTTWVFMLVVFHKITHKSFNLLYLTFIIMMCGLYISHIHPGYYKFYLFNETYTIDKSYEKFIIVDMFFHILSFVFIYKLYRSYYMPLRFDTSMIVSIILLCLYSIFINLYSVYKIRSFELFSIVIIANLLYLLIFD